MKNAHNILGVPANATEAEVKKAYRKLAKVHHPDISGGDPEKFLEISQAYEYMLNPQLSTPFVSTANGYSKSTEQERKDRYERAKKQFKEQQYKEYIEQELYFKNLTSGYRRVIFNILFIGSIFLNSLLFIDYIIPGEWELPHQFEVQKKGDFGGIGHKRLKRTKVNGEGLFISVKQMPYVYFSGYLNIEKSLILGSKKHVAVKEGDRYLIMSPGFSYASSFPLVFMVLLIPVITRMMIKKRNLSFILMYRLTLFGIPFTWLILFLFYI